MDVRDYLKCVWANQATLAGYAFLAGGAVTAAFGLAQEHMSFQSLVQQSPSFLEMIAGVTLLLETDYGSDTLQSYLQTQTHISHKGTIDSFWVYKSSLKYCNYVGTRLAAREHGMGHLMRGLRREDVTQSILGLDR